jgi:hypothetical protein
MHSLFAAALLLGFQSAKPTLAEPGSLQADFNRAKGSPRVVIILSPS